MSITVALSTLFSTGKGVPGIVYQYLTKRKIPHPLRRVHKAVLVTNRWSVNA